LENESNQLAHQLQKKGVKKGGTMGVVFKRSIELLISMLATLKRGANYAPQDIGVCPKDQLSYVLRTSNVKLILTLTLDSRYFESHLIILKKY